MAVENANFIQAAAILGVAGPSLVQIFGAAGVRSFTRDAEGEFSLVLNEPMDCHGGDAPSYRTGVMINNMQPLGAGSVRSFIVTDESNLDPAHGMIKIYAYDAAGELADAMLASVTVFRLPTQV